jgi:hypothetical protein
MTGNNDSVESPPTGDKPPVNMPRKAYTKIPNQGTYQPREACTRKKVTNTDANRERIEQTKGETMCQQDEPRRACTTTRETTDHSTKECGSPHGPLGRIVGGSADVEAYTACIKTSRGQHTGMLLPLPATKQPTQSPQEAYMACNKTTREQHKGMLLPLQATMQPMQSPQEHNNNEAAAHTACNKTLTGQQVRMLLPLPVTKQPTQSPQKHTAYTACKKKQRKNKRGCYCRCQSQSS